MKIENYIKVGNKNYKYTIEKITQNTSIITCKYANIKQEFLNEDIVNLLNDLPSLIIAEQEYKIKKDSIIRFRISGLEKMKLQKKLKSEGYKNFSDYIRSKIL